jgi:hypothetical protein
MDSHMRISFRWCFFEQEENHMIKKNIDLYEEEVLLQ